MNEKYLAIQKEENEIEIYEISLDLDKIKSFPEGKFLGIIEPSSIIKKFRLNQNYFNILLVVNTEKILFFDISEISQNVEIKEPRFVYEKNVAGFYSAIFNPFNSHIIACSCSNNTIQVWSVKQPFIQKIESYSNVIKMKWRDCGKLLGFVDKINILKIYDISRKKFIFYLENIEKIKDFGFFGDDFILIINSDKNKIYKYKYNINKKGGLKITKKIDYLDIFNVDFDYFLCTNNYFILHMKEDIIGIFKDFNKQITNRKCSSTSQKIIKTSNDQIYKILNRDESNISLIILNNKSTIKEKKESKDTKVKEENNSDLEIDSFDNSPDNLDEDYFKGCPKKFLNPIECLNSIYNSDTSKYKKEKEYFKINEIVINLEDNKNKNLAALRKEVKEEMEKLTQKEKGKDNTKQTEKKKTKKPDEDKKKLFESIQEEYMFYLNLLIKDETNTDLLKKYLAFLRDNETKLKKENLPHEPFLKELEYYSIFFEKNELNELFGYSFETEKNKMIKLLQTYSLNIKNNTFKDFQKDIKKKHIRRLFNQPISYNFKELIYYSCNLDLYNDICDNTKKDEKNLTAKRGIIEEIFKRKIFEKYEEFVILIPLVYFICHPEEKENIDFFLNMIESKSLTIDKVKQNYSVIFHNKTKKLLLINGEEAFNEPKELCLENLNNSKYKKYEKYNFEYLIKNPPLKLNINKINKHLEVTLKSNVFKELYIYLTGNDNYQTIFSDEMINDFINKIIYLPVNFCKTASFHD